MGRQLVATVTGPNAAEIRQSLTPNLCSLQPGSKPAAVAGDVEAALLAWGGGVTTKYKARFRTLSFNLKDASNPDLRRRVLSGEVPPEVRERRILQKVFDRINKNLLLKQCS